MLRKLQSERRRLAPQLRVNTNPISSKPPIDHQFDGQVFGYDLDSQELPDGYNTVQDP
jgi:hypothetical protein